MSLGTKSFNNKMFPLIILIFGVFLPVGFSVDIVEIRKNIQSSQDITSEANADSVKIEDKIGKLNEVYKDILFNLSEAKSLVSDENKQTLKVLTKAMYDLKSVKDTKLREQEKRKILREILKRLNLAQKWLTQDINVFEQRKRDGDDKECAKLQERHKILQHSRLLENDDEKELLVEELKQAEIDTFEATEKKKNLNEELKNKQEQWKNEMESAFNLLNQHKNNLVGLKSKVEDKNKEIEKIRKEIEALQKENAELQASIKKSGTKYLQDLKLLKSFHNSAECYLAIRSTLSKTQ